MTLRGRRLGAWTTLLGVVAAIAVMLLPLLLRRTMLRHTDADLFPTLLAFGFSIGAKLLPGALYLPLLLRAPRRAIGAFCLVLGICFVPLAIVDLPAAYQQLVGFNLMRGTSTTALSFFLPDWLADLLRTLALLGTALIAWRYVWSRPQTSVGILKYLLGAHVAFLLTAKLLHNNYLVWIFPIVAGLMALLLAPGALDQAPSKHPTETS